MRVLVTGAFGNIGRHTVDALLPLGASIRAAALVAPEAKIVRAWGPRVEVVRADVTRPETLAAAVLGVDRVLHLAYVIPPECLKRPDEARRVNVDGTLNLIEAVRAHAPSARLLFASSLDVFGRNPNPPPRRLSDPVEATDAYTEHKLRGEELVRASGLPWSIFRYADVPMLALRSPVPIMFEIPHAQRIETLHPYDAGLVGARGLLSEEAWGKTWLVGGGKACQLTYGAYLGKLMAAMEMGAPLPEAAFTTRPYVTDWLDTEDSQRLWQYQRHSFDDIVHDVAALLSGMKRKLARLAQPVVRAYMLSLSPYYRRRTLEPR
jgi:nucleoside-diphosphate-sugar epimerase